MSGGSNYFREQPLAPILEEFVENDEIDTVPKFNRWKKPFKQSSERILGQMGCNAAKATYDDYHKDVVKLTNIFNKLEDYVQQGGEAALKKVGAQKCLADLKAGTTAAVDGLANLLPGSGEKSTDCGYTNWHMGAVLVDDGFSLYAYLDNCDQILTEYKDNQLKSVDKQILDELDNFHKKFQGFCDVMASLGLYDTMMKSRRIIEKDEDDAGTVATEPDTMDSSVESTQPKKAPPKVPRRRKTRQPTRTKKPEMPKRIPRNSSRGSLCSRGSMCDSSRRSSSVAPKPRRSICPINRRSISPSGPGKRPSVSPPRVMRELLPIDDKTKDPGQQRIYSLDSRSDQIWNSRRPDEPTKAPKRQSIPPSNKKGSSLKAALQDAEAATTTTKPTTASRTKASPKRMSSAPSRRVSSVTPKKPEKGAMPFRRQRSRSLSPQTLRAAQSPPLTLSELKPAAEDDVDDSLSVLSTFDDSMPALTKPENEDSLPALSTKPNEDSLPALTKPDDDDEAPPQAPPTKPDDNDDEKAKPRRGRSPAKPSKSSYTVPPKNGSGNDKSTPTKDVPKKAPKDKNATPKNATNSSSPKPAPGADEEDQPNNKPSAANDSAASSAGVKQYVLTITLAEGGPSNAKPRMVVIGHGEEQDVLQGDTIQTNVVAKHFVEAMKNPDDYDLSYFMNAGR